MNILQDNKKNSSIIYFVINLTVDCLYKPIGVIKNLSKHPILILSLFILLFPIYLITQYLISIIKLLLNWSKKDQYNFIDFLFNNSNNVASNHTNENDELFKYLERCSICFESKLDLCIESCKDQFCLECFQRYITEVVQNSWGLSITKIKCPVCRINIHINEWSKYVPNSIIDLYHKFNQPYRNFSKCCPRCETDVIPCDKYNLHEKEDSKKIADMLKDFFYPIQTIDYQQAFNFIMVFEKREWKNSSLPAIHNHLIKFLLQYCQLDQYTNIKNISQKILHLDIRPDTWKKLQFDYISFFSNIECPTCAKEFCLQCGEDSHTYISCEENMCQLIQSNTNSELVENLKWKMNFSQRCPSCSIFIHRDEGCNKVDCGLCGYTFCWECRSSWFDGCSYFVCSNNQQTNSATTHTSEIGVPNMDIIHSRLNT